MSPWWAGPLEVAGVCGGPALCPALCRAGVPGPAGGAVTQKVSTRHRMYVEGMGGAKLQAVSPIRGGLMSGNGLDCGFPSEVRHSLGDCEQDC